VRSINPGVEDRVSIEDAYVLDREDTCGVSFQHVRAAALDELEQFIDEYNNEEGSGHS